MGRLLKVTPAEVLTELQKGQKTKRQLARKFKVTKQTIGNKVRQLRKDGESIVHNSNGMVCVDKVTVEKDEEMAQVVKDFMEWINKVVNGLITCARPTKPLLPAMRRALREDLTSDERYALGQSCLKLKALVDSVEIEAEDLE